jgi:pyridoxamine 5'-phosphate oxidase
MKELCNGALRLARNDLIPPSPSAADYAENGPPPDDAALFAADEPLTLFAEWFALAREKEPSDANAMALATVDAAGMPDVRMVLLKDFDARGFTFYSNAESAKGRQIAAHPVAALNFHWKSLRRTVRLRGHLSEVEPKTADSYFASRDRGARIGAWASDQSRPLESRFALESRIASEAARFGLGEVPRPSHWTGWRLAPLRIEFWRDRPFRLHDRLEFSRTTPAEAWRRQRLFP